jgi:DNA polymerase-3 subunit gamma/tau
VLLNAGHSPSSLARQMVRYLRNALMAKLGGEQTELLQISADERARANRTAMLFSEEDLTRNLQIVLRTFDELNYRQEQRFHLELGLLKLVHAQRLLPLEELLSGVASGAPVRSAAPAPRASAPAAPPPRTAAAPAVPASKPASTLSPFGASPFESASASGSSASGTWGSAAPTIKQNAAPEPVAEMPEPVPVQTATPIVAAPMTPASIAVAPPPVMSPVTPFPAASAAPAIGFAETLTEGSLAKAPSAAASPGEAADVDTLRQAVVQALAQAGHQSASTLLGAGAWTIDGANLRIEVAGMGKKMLSLTVNAAAEKIIRQELQKAGGPARFMVVPGEAAAGGPAMAAPLAGSVQEEALNHPLVQRAKEIFNAEVRSVVDLRTK